MMELSDAQLHWMSSQLRQRWQLRHIVAKATQKTRAGELDEMAAPTARHGLSTICAQELGYGRRKGRHTRRL